MNRTIITIVAVTVLMLTQGCASLFSIGEEDFACKGNSEGGSCQDPMSIYKQRHEILTAQTDKKDKAKDKTKKDKAKDKKQQPEAIKTINEQPATTSLSDKEHVQRTIPVRQTEEIRRVYVNGFEDRHGNLIGDFWGYVVVRDGKWLTLDGRHLRNAEDKKKE
jgi:type IV conjugative transfer system lipoprotein TraV